MSAVIQDIADAVAARLNGASLSQQFEAVRCFIPSYSINETPGLQVFVLGLSQVHDLDNGYRDGSSLDTYSISVAIYRQVGRDSFGQPDSAALDAMVQLVQEIVDEMKRPAVLLEDGSSLVGVRCSPLYDPAALDSTGTFVSVVQLDYRLLR